MIVVGKSSYSKRKESTMMVFFLYNQAMVFFMYRVCMAGKTMDKIHWGITQHQ